MVPLPDLTVIAEGDAPGGELWYLRAGGSAENFYTLLETVHPDGSRDEGGMGGPLLSPGRSLNVYTGRSDGGPLRVVVRADRKVRRLYFRSGEGEWCDLPPVADDADLGVTFFAILLPWATGIASMQGFDADDQELSLASLAVRPASQGTSPGYHGRDRPVRSATMGMTSCRPERRNPVSRPHQPGQDVFRSVLPDDIDWKPFAAFPPPARLAVVVGQPTEPGPYVIRVKVPSGVKLMPHRHPEDRVYTVISGVFYIGLGDEFDGDGVTAYPPGSVIVLPGGTSHFHWAKSGEYVTQVTAIGPLGLEYVDPEDDPRAQPA
jgi:quercetin dioxygenase-like cupin family protein